MQNEKINSGSGSGSLVRLHRGVTGPRLWAGGPGLEGLLLRGSAALLSRGLGFLPRQRAAHTAAPTLRASRRGRGPPGRPRRRRKPRCRSRATPGQGPSLLPCAAGHTSSERTPGRGHRRGPRGKLATRRTCPVPPARRRPKPFLHSVTALPRLFVWSSNCRLPPTYGFKRDGRTFFHNQTGEKNNKSEEQRLLRGKNGVPGARGQEEENTCG